MIENFSILLRKTVEGDDVSLSILLIHFKEHTLSIQEQEQTHAYLKQAAHSHHHAIYLRGLLYEYGYGVKQDFTMSFLFMREAASKGHAKAIYEIGHHFLQGLGVEKNETHALQWLTRAAESPYYVAEAMFDLGLMYEQGLGVEVDLKQAEKWYEQAAQKSMHKKK